jgi:hypothetical protein
MTTVSFIQQGFSLNFLFFFISEHRLYSARSRDSVVGIVDGRTGWTIRISNPGREEEIFIFSETLQTGPGANQVFCSVGTAGFFPEGKAAVT